MKGLSQVFDHGTEIFGFIINIDVNNNYISINHWIKQFYYCNILHYTPQQQQNLDHCDGSDAQSYLIMVLNYHT